MTSSCLSNWQEKKKYKNPGPEFIKSIHNSETDIHTYADTRTLWVGCHYIESFVPLPPLVFAQRRFSHTQAKAIGQFEILRTLRVHRKKGRRYRKKEDPPRKQSWCATFLKNRGGLAPINRSMISLHQRLFILEEEVVGLSTFVLVHTIWGAYLCFRFALSRWVCAYPNHFCFMFSLG